MLNVRGMIELMAKNQSNFLCMEYFEVKIHWILFLIFQNGIKIKKVYLIGEILCLNKDCMI